MYIYLIYFLFYYIHIIYIYFYPLNSCKFLEFTPLHIFAHEVSTINFPLLKVRNLWHRMINNMVFH